MTLTRPGLRPLVASITLVLLTACIVSLPTPASAAFSQAVSVSPAGYDSYHSQANFDRQGDALFVWVRESHNYPYPRHIQMRSRSHTGTWGSTVTVSPSGQDPRLPKVALDDDGDAIVVWHAYAGGDYRVYARRVSRTGTLGTLKVLSPTGAKVHGTDVAIDSDGDAVVTWNEWHDDGRVLPMMRRYTKSGSLPAAVLLASSPARAETPAVAFDREGDAVLAWANDNVVQARTLSVSGTLSGLKTVSPNLSPIDRHFTARVAVDRDGDALVTWRHWTDADQSTQVWGRWVSRYGTVGNVRQLTPSSHPDVVNYSVASDLDGDVLLTWDRFQNKYLYARPISRTATIGAPVLLSASGRLHSVRVDDDGDGSVVWQGAGISGTVGSVRTRRVTRSGTWGTTQVIATNGVSPTTAVSPVGRVIVAWERRFQVDLRIQVSAGP
ncbi:hypothetical protein [Actinomadura alba]|uniref:Uncharacterized protein n=1 Tax=Actinomadura alba TaxID=406431 RepID=A0ABR7LP88_9ACTN|nr:hypothetical protein [Actinomadura alba]MBC6466300.1 hypothetical protein [Actinomadura alba]